MPFADTDITASIDTDKQLYTYGDTVKINTETLSSPFGRTADMTIAILDELGYKAVKVQPVDMFPCTSHVETVTLLQQTKQ